MARPPGANNIADGPSRRPRVFIDSSVFIAAAISSTGAARQLIERGLRGEVELAVSDLVLEETERNLERKAPRAVPLFRFLVGVLPLTVVNPNDLLTAHAVEVVDPKDAPIVAAAVESGADWLATHDQRHLLNLSTQIAERLGVSVADPGRVVRELDISSGRA